LEVGLLGTRQNRRFRKKQYVIDKRREGREIVFVLVREGP